MGNEERCRHRFSRYDDGSKQLYNGEKQRCLTKSLSGPLHYEDSPPSSPTGTSSPRGGSKRLHRLISWSRLLRNAGGAQAAEEAEEWMLDLSQLLLGQKFASGARSRLYHGIYCGSPVAVKVTRDAALFNREVSLLSKLHHQNVVQLVGACKKEGCCCVVTDYLGGGSLGDLLDTAAATAATTRTLAMALDIARGLDYVHSQGIVHRDVKPDNLLLDDERNVRVGDFGVARYEHECCSSGDGEDEAASGTYRWMAPEMVSRRPHGKKVDVYSFGIVLWQLVTSTSIPFAGMTPVQAAYAVVNKHARPLVPQDCDPLLAQLMQQCWSPCPEQRPDFREIVRKLELLQESSAVGISR